MEVTKCTLRDLLGGNAVYVIPLFQRRYVWGKKNWEPLAHDVLSLTESPHFMGAIVCAKESAVVGQPTVYQVIDGQQRITTLALMLCALRDLAIEEEDEDTAQRIERHILNDEKSDTFRYKVYPRYWDRAGYFAVIKRQLTGNGALSGQMNMPKTYSFFKNEIANQRGDMSLRGIFDGAMDLLHFASITLTDSESEGENIHKIFRSLNTLGLDLRMGDLIRNYVYMSVPRDEQDEFDISHWRPLESMFQVDRNVPDKIDDKDFEQFFRMSLRMDGKSFRDEEAYSKFEARHPAAQIQQNPGQLVGKYRTLADFWLQIRGDQSSGSSEVDDALRRIAPGELSVGVAYPLVMRLLHLRADGKMSDADTVEALRLVSGFFLRRHICGKSSRAYGKWFCEACAELGTNPLNNLRYFLARRRDGWPEDEEFANAFVSCNLYDTGYCAGILRRMAREMERASPPAVKVDIENADVEHVMPQNLSDKWKKDLGDEANEHEKWVHTPGNLALLDKRAHRGSNPLSNKSFSEKKALLRAPNAIPFHDGIFDLPQWGIKEIRGRGENLAQVAVQIWPGSGRKRKQL